MAHRAIDNYLTRRQTLSRLAALGGWLAVAGLASACQSAAPAPTAAPAKPTEAPKPAAPAATSAPAAPPAAKPAEAPKPAAPAQAAPAVQPAGGTPITLKYSHEGTENWQGHLWGLKMGEALKDLSKGQVTVQIFPNAQLGKNKENLEAMQTGTAAVQMVAAGAQDTTSWVPDMDVMDLPYLFTSAQHQFKVADGEIGQSIFKKFEDRNWMGIGWLLIGVRHLTNNKHPVNTLDDLKGIKLRVLTSKLNIETWKALGVTPVPIPFADVYLALKQGTVDGQENPTTTIRVQNYWEVQKYLSLTSHSVSSSFLIMDAKLFQRLGAEVQKMIMDAGKVATDYERQFVLEDEAKSKEFIISKGMVENTVADLEPFRKATAGIADIVGGPVPALAAKIREVKI